ncbi:PREDICTED: WD repeat-containing protein 44-like isoform X3 [Populus euphratica]|uniref:WD repeat-containing protein 44-like isoform X3 n=1 Tax=Populus euphratica TaxID=75702 RepID=A0AAJ6U912_POPEU|nr:PREDICTED: WD repeat-containing protein 44-like isoform X3 [Populus euphratica]
MGSLSEEEYRFFDANEDIASISDAKSDSFEIFDSHSSFHNSVSSSLHHELWIKSLGSVQEHRSKFFDLMGIGLNENGNRNLEALSPEGESDRIPESSGAVLRKSCFEDEFCSTRSMMSCWSNGESSLSAELGLLGNFVCREGDSGGGMMCEGDELGQDVKANEGCEVDSEQSVPAEESENISESSPSFQKPMRNEVGEPNTMVDTPRRLKKGWLSRIRSISCIVYSLREADKLRHDDDDDDDTLLRYRVQRVKVHRYGKRIKELSALYKGQDIQAHEGSILTMKFSPDGQYLASAGEDGVVRVWQVLESERSNELDIPEIDPSCIYFTVNQLSELKPLLVEKGKTAKMRSMRKTSDSACVIFPPKVFRILEKPLHEFHGHREEILDLSWSKNNQHLLSASVDKTVCLWQVGRDCCLRVFLHSNYVTCVQFNPVDDNHFMSGSIDGKVRIWAVNSCQVVDWTDIKDIVTAVCYRPDGQGGIVGSLTGICRFYNMSGSDSYLQLDAQICLPGKKKSPCKRITGFQFSPQDSTKVMVSCADSQVRILQGLDVIGKYKSNTANQISASFTSDGKHIISACEDSSVHLWNYIDQEQPATPQSKKSRSYEHFSANASVAIPWCGLKCGSLDNGWGFRVSDNNSQEVLPLSSPAHFSLSQEYFSESFPKGCATWPEEKLSSSPLSTSSAMHKSQYKFLKSSCQSADSSHAWGLVIVTAGWDGRIKSFHNYGLPVSD